MALSCGCTGYGGSRSVFVCHCDNLTGHSFAVAPVHDDAVGFGRRSESQVTFVSVYLCRECQVEFRFGFHGHVFRLEYIGVCEVRESCCGHFTINRFVESFQEREYIVFHSVVRAFLQFGVACLPYECGLLCFGGQSGEVVLCGKVYRLTGPDTLGDGHAFLRGINEIFASRQWQVGEREAVVGAIQSGFDASHFERGNFVAVAENYA